MKVFTFGYTGSTPQDLAAFVEETGALLVDIRLNPYSRVPHWTGAALREQFGDGYLYVREAGNLNYRDGGPIMLADRHGTVRRLRPILAERPVILLCACVDWARCHRLVAATLLADELGCLVEHLPAKHWEWTGQAAPVGPGAPETIPTLTLLDPWATLVKVGAKRQETRSWGTSYRGPLLIHSSKRFAGDDKHIATYTPAIRAALVAGGVHFLKDLPRGAIIARCRLVDCRQITTPPEEPEATFGDYTPGRWAWHLADVEPLPEPVPARGALGLWQFPLASLTLAYEGPVLAAASI